ncbi:coenzyme PQQ synthesis protein D (PqqD) [Breoghania corrubedonensis]|uniref:Coenzyme PQQ synthesis protein D (PqqD) n=1 Tax=Breoghania corrubedonensis TaxID=665038 RepID=A0A2T5UU71_9HYPH|nr:PqqD family protein [Breoghania corrubedonensis]PTW55066.1 coenzyme PQQ synthesis protein D (PqqD) [Breoghania corrubedonensis]
MTASTKFVLAGPDVVCEEFDGEFVILDLETGCYFSLNRSASAIWKLLEAGFAPLAIEAALGETIKPLLGSLQDHKLMAPSDEPGNSELDDQARISLGTIENAPTFEVFDDLADLIRADPVHDVDEAAGWPLQKEAIPS